MGSLCVSPKLYWVPSHHRNFGERFQSNLLEFFGQAFISMAQIALRLVRHSSPFLVILYCSGRVGPFDIFRDLKALGNWALLILLPCLTALVGGGILRTWGRYQNPVYMEFVRVLNRCRRDMSSENKLKLSQYDFDFRSSFGWPVEFYSYRAQARCCRGSATYVTNPDQSFELIMKSIVVIWLIYVACGISDNDLKDYGDLVYMCIQILRTVGPFVAASWLIISKFGIKIVYNGTLQSSPGAHSVQRCEMILKRGAERFKLETDDNNHIDAIFFDRRSDGKAEGKFLVICCEGNCGFYECGINRTPLARGFSVLAWNHPGFNGSSGDPYPTQEAHAADAVMLFALSKLRFQQENIIVFGWSIGGFTATWLGMNYPDIYGMILDSTFDTLDIVAAYRCSSFPPFIVRNVCNYIAYINVDKQLAMYHGPVRIIRRTRDEMMSVGRDSIDTNRTSHLLLHLLLRRYPNLTDDHQALQTLTAYVGGRENTRHTLLERFAISSAAELGEVVRSDSHYFPSNLGGSGGLDSEMKTRLLLLLTTQYMQDFDASHCVQLPQCYFSLSPLLMG